MEENNKLGIMPMPRLVVNMAWPMMLSLLIQSLYNIVDSIFVARISEDALTAVSLAYPVQILMIAVAVGTGVGANAVLSRCVGAKKYEETRDLATTGTLLAVAGAVVFMILGIFCTKAFVGLFTSDEAIGAYAAQYLFICMLFCAGTFVGTMYQRYLQAVGNAFDSMLTLVAGALTNLILDPLLIFGIGFFPQLGIRGAAIATVIGQWLTAVIAVVLNARHNPLVQPRLHGYRLQKRVFAQIYQVGLPTIIMQALGSFMLSAVNAILMPFSSTAVAFFGVYYKLQSFLFMPMNGLGQAAIPIAGYSLGAGKLDRIRKLFRTMLPMAVGIAVVITVVFEVIPGPLLSVFSAGEEMLAIGVPALRIISLTFAFASVTMVLGYILSGLGNGIVNMIATALRQLVLLVPCLWLLSRFCGVANCWYAFWISEVVAMAYAVWATIRYLNKKIYRGRDKNTRRADTASLKS